MGDTQSRGVSVGATEPVILPEGPFISVSDLLGSRLAPQRQAREFQARFTFARVAPLGVLALSPNSLWMVGGRPLLWRVRVLRLILPPLFDP